MSRIHFASLLLVLVGCAGSQSKALPTYTETHTEQATATVLAINHSTREVKLRSEDGLELAFVAAPAVRNFSQIQVGDHVKVEYTESIALEVRRADGTQPDMNVQAAVERAEPGAKPAGKLGQQVNLSAVIVAIDKPSLRVTVKGPAGNLRVLQVRDPKNLENVQVGDMIYVTYTESYAVSVEKVSP